MMRWIAGTLAPSLLLVACGGSYAAGSMDREDRGGSSSVAGEGRDGNTNNGASSSVAGSGSLPVAGTSSVSPGGPVDEFGPQCVPSGDVPMPSGTFAEPSEIWQRISRLTWGTPMASLTEPLPATATSYWASSMVDVSLASANAKLGSVPGVELFLRQWLELADTDQLEGSWASDVPLPLPVLQRLLGVTFGDDGRVGVFSEQSWLARHATISGRGSTMIRALFAQAVPPAPPGESIFTPDPTLTDRAAVEASVQNPTCGACHNLFDPVGYTLGHFDAIGGYRELDHGQPIDTTGTLRISDVVVAFDGIADFGGKVADTCAANVALADSFLAAALAINNAPADSRAQLVDANKQRVEQAFIHGGRTYGALLKAYIQSPAGLSP